MIHSFSNEDRAGLGLAFTNSELENKYSISFFANHAGPEVKLGYRTLGKVDFSEDGEKYRPHQGRGQYPHRTPQKIGEGEI